MSLQLKVLLLQEAKTLITYKGIGGRNFRREFTLAEHIEVEQAGLELGMLNIHLVRNVPEAQKPKKISIKNFDAIEG